MPPHYNPTILFSRVFSLFFFSTTMAAPRIPTRQQYRFMADLANHGGRCKDTMIYMNSLIADWVSPSSELRPEEAKQLVRAYNNVIAPLRAAWRTVASIEGKNEARKNGEKARLSQEYRAVIELEISEVCEGNLRLLREVVIPSASGTEPKVFFYLMKGDLERYLAELKVGDERKEVAEKARLSYETAQVCDSLNTGATKLFVFPYSIVLMSIPSDSLALARECEVYRIGLVW